MPLLQKVLDAGEVGTKAVPKERGQWHSGPWAVHLSEKVTLDCLSWEAATSGRRPGYSKLYKGLGQKELLPSWRPGHMLQWLKPDGQAEDDLM